MASTKTPARKRLDELLADGRWHDRAELIERTVGFVPPGVAARRARNARARQRDRYARALDQQGIAPQPAQGGTGPADDIRVGARYIVRGTIASAIRNGTYARRTHRGTVQIRRRSETGGE